MYESGAEKKRLELKLYPYGTKEDFQRRKVA